MAQRDTALDEGALAALLDWYVENGVDLALDDAPHDRYAESARAAPAAPQTAIAVARDDDSALAPSCEVPAPRPPPAPTNRVVAAPAFPLEVARAAQALAAAARDLDDLRAKFEAFDGAPFKSMARHFLFSAGTPGTRLMVLDFAPGETEERGGEPFSGPQANLLDNMLAAIGFDRESAYLAYFSPWRPPGDKAATPQETGSLAPFARRHVELARPDVLMLIGDTPVRAMLETDDATARLRGKWFDCVCGELSVRAMAFAGLTAMLNAPSLKPAAWRDLRAIADALR
jgi:DNA polymerase